MVNEDFKLFTLHVSEGQILGQEDQELINLLKDGFSIMSAVVVGSTVIYVLEKYDVPEDEEELRKALDDAMKEGDSEPTLDTPSHEEIAPNGPADAPPENPAPNEPEAYGPPENSEPATPQQEVDPKADKRPKKGR